MLNRRVRGRKRSAAYGDTPSSGHWAFFRTVALWVAVYAASGEILEEEQNDSSAFDYFDALRTNPYIQVERDPSSSILRITTPWTDNNGTTTTATTHTKTYRLAELKCFLPLSDNGRRIRIRALDDAFAVFLAIDHFNNRARNPGIFGRSQGYEEDSCDIRFTAEVIDTEFSSVSATYSYVNLLSATAQTNQAPVAAVIGASRSAVSAPLAILSGVSATPQVSWGATAFDFDDKEQYPYFGRTITNTVEGAQAALHFFQSFVQSTHVTILYITDQYGLSLQQSFVDAAAAVGITTASIGMSFDVTEDPNEAQRVMQQVKNTQYFHVYCILFRPQLAAIARAAQEVGLVGPQYFYAIHGPDAADMQWASRNGDLTFSQAEIDFLNGAGIIQAAGGFGGFDFDEAMQESDKGFHHLFFSWRRAWKDQAFMDYVTSKLPSSLDRVPGFDRAEVVYSQDPGAYRPFLYDAVFALGDSMCHAGASKPFFDGPSVMERFRGLRTTGASGNLTIDNTTGTRAAGSVTFVMWNIIFDAKEKLLQFRQSARLLGLNFSLLPESEFRFADGGLNPPPSLPPLQENFNYIGNAGRIVGYSLMGLTIVASLLCMVWLYRNRTSRVVHAAQPLFLILVATGSIVSISSLIPLSAEEPVLDSDAALDFSCMASPWLYVIGSNISLSALLSKTFKVYQAYCDPSLEYIKVNFSDIFRVLLSLVAVSGSLLALWSIAAPLEWRRTYRGNTDIFLRLTDSYGECSGSTASFAVILVAVNFGFLFLGSWHATVTRHVETEYGESLYINLSLFSILQAWIMGIVILSVTYDDPQARFYLMSGIIFVTSTSSLVFIFVPKYMALKNDITARGKKAYLECHRSTRLNIKSDTSNNDGNEGEHSGHEDNSVSSESSAPVNEGSKILHNPKSARNLMVSGGVALSRRQIAEISKSPRRVADGRGDEVHGEGLTYPNLHSADSDRCAVFSNLNHGNDNGGQGGILPTLDESTGSLFLTGEGKEHDEGEEKREDGDVAGEPPESYVDRESALGALSPGKRVVGDTGSQTFLRE